MGFRKRESNQEGFGIQRNEKTKASNSNSKKPRKKAKKKAVTKKQGSSLEPMTQEQYQEALRAISAKSDEPIKSKVELKIEDLLARGKKVPPRLLRQLDRITAAAKTLTGEELSLLEQASRYRPGRASNIVASGVSGDDITMTNQQAQDQGQSLTNEQIAMLQAQANAEAKAKAIADAMANPMGPMMPRDDMMLNPPAQRGAIIGTPEGPMIIDPITGVLMPLPITTPGYGLPPGDGMMQGPRMEDGFFDVMPIPIDPVTGLPFTNQDPVFVPGVDPSMQDNVRIGDGYGFKNGGIK